MSTTIQFISQIKLGELRRQRELLLESYDRLVRECADKSPFDRLKALADGLKRIRVAGKPMHSDQSNIELLLRGTAHSSEIVDFWCKRLEAEITTGRLRADIVYLFGALLGEWGDEDTSKEAFLEERNQAETTLLRNATTPPRESNQDFRSLLDDALAGLSERMSGAPARIAEAIDKAIESGNNAVSGLSAIAKDIYQPPAIRQEAKRFSDDAVLQTQFEDALRVVTRDLRDWSWPADGVSTRTLWTRNKWRMYPTQSLIQLSIIHSFGHFWSHAVDRVCGNALRRINRLSRLHKLLDLNAPEVIIQNDRRMLREEEERIDLDWYEPVDPFDGTPPIPADGKILGIVSRRVTEQAELREHGIGGYYEGYGANRIVKLVNAEVRTLRAAFPDRPLFIANLDIRDYFASIPHRLLLQMLERLGLPKYGIEAIRRFLEVPYLVNGRIETTRVGVPMDQYLSHWLAEWLLRLMERFVHQRARVRIIRQIDDICLLSPTDKDIVAAWRAAHEFIERCGLAVNTDKCGALALNSDLPGELPRRRPQWGMLELTTDGEWGVHEATFHTFLQDARKHVSARHALLARVTMYNAHLRFLTSALGLALDLGDAHRQAVDEALRRFEAGFFGSGVSVVAGLRNAIGERYLGDTHLGHLPEGWMHWPITAGGLSLRSALVLGGQYHLAIEERKSKRLAAPTERPADWQYRDQKWAAYYEDQLQVVKPAKPRESKVMKTMVDDFIARGQEISGGKQEGLSDYWRWVLCIYGPEILDKFGTFRFLLTDLVPLQLIHEQLTRDSSLSE